MAGLWRFTQLRPFKQILPCSNKIVHCTINCCSAGPNLKGKETPQLLKIAVSGLTELLRIFPSYGSRDRAVLDNESKAEVSVSNVDDILTIVKSDYENAYFVTGTELYARNLILLVPFFDDPSIQLIEIEKSLGTEAVYIFASWKLRTYLKLPWKPCISVDGRTTYDVDEEFRIVKHTESWNISALEAIIQIFTPSL